MPKGTSVIDRLVGARVRLRRQALGMSQTELAQAIGLTFQQIQKYEQGKNRIGAGRLAKIAEVLRVPVAHFFEDLPAPGPSEVAADALAAAMRERGSVDLVKAYAAISDRQVRQRLLDLARALAGEEMTWADGAAETAAQAEA
jgi:transcriptional regulator with XRE-family HTH domain